MNMQQFDEHFENVDLAQMEPGGANHFTAEDVRTSPAEVLGKVCNIYHVIRPFLNWASNFFLIPKKVKMVLDSFVSLMDTVCPAA